MLPVRVPGIYYASIFLGSGLGVEGEAEGRVGLGESLSVALGVELLAVVFFAEKSWCSVAGLQAVRVKVPAVIDANTKGTSLSRLPG